MWHTLTIEETITKLGTNINKGLNDKNVHLKRNKYGENKFLEEKKVSLLRRFLIQFKDFMIIILIIAAIVSAIISYLEKTNEYIDSVIIIVIVVLNALIGVIQEEKAKKSLDALKKMAVPICKVKRNGNLEEIKSEDLVPGDIVYIDTGSYVPADIRLIKTYNLKIEESSLTGETVHIEKDANKVLDPNIPVGDMVNMAFSTTVVIRRTWNRNCSRNWYEYKSR